MQIFKFIPIYTYFRDFSRAGQQESARATRPDNSVRQNASKLAFAPALHDLWRCLRQAAPRQNASKLAFALGLHYLWRCLR